MELVDSILSICKTIYGLTESVKANKESCNRVAKRVRALEGLVRSVNQRGPAYASPQVNNALKDLCDELTAAKELIYKFAQVSSTKGFLHSSKHKDKFYKLNERLDDCFQVLSGALQIEQRQILVGLCENISQPGARQHSTMALCAGQTTAGFPNPAGPLQLPAPGTSSNPALPSPPGPSGSLQPFPQLWPPLPPTTPLGPPVTFPSAPVPNSPGPRLPFGSVFEMAPGAMGLPGCPMVIPPMPGHASMGPFVYPNPNIIARSPSFMALQNTSVTRCLYTFPPDNPFLNSANMNSL